MKKLIFVSLATFLAIALFLAGPVSADDIMEKMLEPIPDEAVKALLQKYPEDAQVHLGAAFLFTEDKNKAEAKAKAIKLAPAYKKIFLIQEVKRDHDPYKEKEVDEEALRKLEELVKIDPGNVWPHYLLGAHYLHKGEKEEWLKELDEALSKEGLDDYEGKRLRAIFRVLDELNPSFKVVRKNQYHTATELTEFHAAPALAYGLVSIGKELEEKGERERALEYYRKTERIGHQLLLKKPHLFITIVTSIHIRRIAYSEMERFYEEEGRLIETAAVREQFDLMHAWSEKLGGITHKQQVVSGPISAASVDVNYLGPWKWEDIRPEKRQEIKEKLDGLRENGREVLNSPDYVKMVDKFLDKFWREGEIEACESLPEPKESPVAQFWPEYGKQLGQLKRTITQSLLPRENQEACKSNLKQIGLACLMFALDHKDVLPPNLAVLGKAGYMEERYFPKWMKCPVSGEEYVYIGAGKSTRKVKNPSRTIIAYDKKPVHDNGRNVVFMDGHCEWMSEEELQKRLAEQKRK